MLSLARAGSDRREFDLIKRMYRAVLAPLGLTIGLLGCASDPAHDSRAWIANSSPGSAASGSLEQDVQACNKLARSSKGEQEDSYSDPRYGAVNAMAAALDKTDLGKDSRRAGERARFELCMTGKGWHRANSGR
jgi:hypothetical protein